MKAAMHPAISWSGQAHSLRESQHASAQAREAQLRAAQMRLSQRSQRAADAEKVIAVMHPCRVYRRGELKRLSGVDAFEAAIGLLCRQKRIDKTLEADDLVYSLPS